MFPSEAPASTPARQGAPRAIVRLRVGDRSRSKDNGETEATYDIPDAGGNRLKQKNASR